MSGDWPALVPAFLHWRILWLAAPCAAEPPRIVPVRLPSAQVVSWFPPGTELRMLAPEKFDELVESARRGTAHQGTTLTPRLIRARHQARWDAGVLIGRSELVVQHSGSDGGSSIVALEPWTPAILSSGPKEVLAGALDSGKAALGLDRAHAAGDIHRHSRLDAARCTRYTGKAVQAGPSRR